MDDTFFAILVLGAFGAATAYAANERGRNPIAWFFAGFFGGVIGLALVFILPPAKAQAPRTASAVVGPASVFQASTLPVAAQPVPAAQPAPTTHSSSAAQTVVASQPPPSAPLGEALLPPAAPPVPRPQCAHCGRTVPADASFCPYCAAPMTSSAPADISKLSAATDAPEPVVEALGSANRTCPDCAEPMPSAAKHCPYCGYTL